MPDTSYISGASPIATKVYAKGGATLNDTMKSYAEAVASKLGFPVVVTSGVRSAYEQALALQGKISAGSTDSDLYKLYADDDIVRDILRYKGNVAGMASVLTSYMARGRYMSRHMRGDALDLRVTGLSSSEIAQLAAAAKATGGQVIIENNPPHIHVENLSGNYLSRAVTAVASATGTTSAVVAIGGASFVGLAAASALAVAVGIYLASRRST